MNKRQKTFVDILLTLLLLCVVALWPLMIYFWGADPATILGKYLVIMAIGFGFYNFIMYLLRTKPQPVGFHMTHYDCSDACDGDCNEGVVILDKDGKKIPADECICAARSINDCACGAWYIREDNCDCNQ